MKLSNYTDRIGGFAGVNAGVIENCYTENRITGKHNAAGFIYDNSGKVVLSIAKSRIKQDENNAEFIRRNSGSIQKSGWIRKKSSAKKLSSVDRDTLIEADAVSELRDKFGLSSAWTVTRRGGSADIFLDERNIPAEVRETAGTVTDIDCAEDLLNLASCIAEGDLQAARGHYRLTRDVNLKGRKWLPIGLSEDMPFSGLFDGGNHKIYNFKIQSSELSYAGFFGYVKGGQVVNLRIDCVANGKNGTVTGCMCGMNDNGLFANCHVTAKVTVQKCFGGFVGKNSGAVLRSSFAGKLSPVIPPALIIAPTAGAAAILLAVGGGIVIDRLVNDEPYKPAVIDPNQKPASPDPTPTPPPPEGSNRISFELNQEVYVNVQNGVGIIDYVNPQRSTQDVVISVRVSDAQLIKVMGKTGRKPADQQALEQETGYDPAKSFQELYRSGRLQIGYKLDAMKLSALPDGTMLPKGDYEMTVVIDAYNPETHEKAVVSAQAPITVHIVDPKPAE